VLEREAALIGRATAAEAEYRAILLGLQLAERHGPTRSRFAAIRSSRSPRSRGPHPVLPSLAYLTLAIN
jgi:hypothetical protein